MRWLRSLTSIVLTLLLIEFMDEFVFGAREAAWPLIRDDLGLSYTQVGVILSVPAVFSSLVEPFIGILGDVWRRRFLILGGGVIFSLALFLVALSHNFWALLLPTLLLYPASGAFVSLSQAELMDADPPRHEKNMARWTFAGSLGVVAGPLALGGITLLGANWRVLFGIFALLSLMLVILAWRSPSIGESTLKTDQTSSALSLKLIGRGFRGAWSAMKRGEVIRWLILLQFADLVLDILHGYLALYFTDVVGVEPLQAGLAVAVWTGAGLMGDFLLLPVLEKVNGLRYLRLSVWLVLFLFPAFLLAPGLPSKLVIGALLGLLNSGWYAIPQGQLYSAMPGQSGTVITLANIFGLIGGLFPLMIGLLAQQFGLQTALWMITLGPVALLIGLPRRSTPAP